MEIETMEDEIVCKYAFKICHMLLGNICQKDLIRLHPGI